MHLLIRSTPSRARSKVILGLACLISLSVVAADLSAAGFFLPVRGVRPLGRAGASTASGSGVHAMWYNPASMIKLEGTHVLLEAALVNLTSSFDRTPRFETNGDVIEYERVTNGKAPDLIPSLMGTSDFGLERVVFGLGLMPPYGLRYIYPETGAQRYAAVRNDQAASASIALGASVQVTDWLAVGAMFHNQFFDMKIITTSSGYQGLFGRPEDPDLDILLSIHSVDPFTPSGSFGVLITPLPEFEVGLSFLLPSTIEDTDAQVEVRLPSHAFFDGAEVEGSTVSGSFDLPWVFRSGVRYIQPRWDIELNVTVEGWSVHDAIYTTPEDVKITNVFQLDEVVVGPLTIPEDYHNSINLSLGSDYQVIPDVLTLRAGINLEQAAIPVHRLSNFQIDTDKVMPTFGLSWAIPNSPVILDFAYAHVFFVDEEVTNSQVTQINPTFEDGAITVGNGFYQASADLVGLSIEAAF